MDLRNNAVGRNLGATYRFATNNTIKNKVIKAVDYGKLWRVNSKIN